MIVSLFHNFLFYSGKNCAGYLPSLRPKNQVIILLNYSVTSVSSAASSSTTAVVSTAVESVAASS